MAAEGAAPARREAELHTGNELGEAGKAHGLAIIGVRAGKDGPADNCN